MAGLVAVNDGSPFQPSSTPLLPRSPAIGARPTAEALSYHACIEGFISPVRASSHFHYSQCSDVAASNDYLIS